MTPSHDFLAMQKFLLLRCLLPPPKLSASNSLLFIGPGLRISGDFHAKTFVLARIIYALKAEDLT
jgi:hypothetical protein